MTTTTGNGLAGAERLWRDAAEAMSDAVMLLDADDRLVATNGRYRELHGLDEADLTPGLPWRDLLARDVARGHYADAAGREAEVVAQEIAARARPGEPWDRRLASGLWLRCRALPARDGGTILVQADVTRERLNEARLEAVEREARESEERLREIVGANPVPMTITRTRDGLVVYANQRAADMVRVPLEALHGQRSVDFYAREEDRDTVLKLLREKGRVELLEVHFKRGDGTVFPLALICRPIMYLGEPAIVSGFHELSDWRRLEEALHQNEKLAALGSLLAGVAHELNNPLSVVLAQTFLLQETSENEATLRRAERIHSAADRCARIVRSFLAIARQRAPEYRPVDLADVMHRALELTAYGLRSNGIEVALDCPEDLPAVWGDADQLGQVFMNLVVNAQQAVQTRQGRRTLSLAARFDAGRHEVTIRVADNGPGVPPAIRSRIFDAFFTTKPVGVGTGVGLSVCLGIVGAHGGTLSLDETAPEGAAFVITLPAADAAALAAPEAARAILPGDARWSILVVDDEPDIRQTMAEILEPLASRVDLAENGLAALALADERRYDLIVSDLRMPELDGPGLYERLAGRGCGVSERMIFVTGDTLHHELEGFLKTTRAPILEKPFAPNDVRRRVAEFMAGL